MGERNSGDSNANAVQRDAAMVSLIVHGHNLVTRLALLSQAEKEAVLALVAIGQAVAGYAHTPRPDAEVLESFVRTLDALSPVNAHRLLPNSLLHACRDEFGAYELAVARCLEGGRRKREECEREAVDLSVSASVTAQIRSLYTMLAPAVGVTRR